MSVPSSSESLLIPFTFLNLSQTRTELSDLDQCLLEASWSQTRPRVVKSWRDSGTPLNMVEGMIIGSHDGTLYIFNRSRTTPQSQPQPSRPTSPQRFSHHSHTPSRSSTPSATSTAPFNVVTRSRIVSGVNTEQIEAPKNYVDFEDEPDKLKEMLKGRGPKDSREKLAASDSDQARDVAAEKSPILGPKHKNIPKSILSPANSSSLSFSVPSPQDSASLETTHDLNLWCHVVLPRSGPGKAVTGICLLGNNNEFFATLQETGDISVFSLRDGGCLATIHVDDTLLQPPAGVKDRDISHDIWVWSYLEVYRVGESTILLASAANTSSLSSTIMEVESDGAPGGSCLAMFEFHAKEDLAPLEIGLTKVGSWYFDGPAQGIGIHQESDNTSTFFSITSGGHFIVRRLQLLPRVPVQMDIRAPDTHILNLPSSLPLPNPFRAIKPRSKGHLSLGEKVGESGRISLEEESNLGKLPISGPLLGIRCRTIIGGMMAAAWTPEELILFEYRERSLHVLYSDPIVKIIDLEWSDDVSYTVLLQGKAIQYTIKSAQLDFTGADTGEKASNNRRPEILRVISVDKHEAAEVSPTSEILTISSCGNGKRITTSSSIGPDGKLRSLWKTSSRLTGGSRNSVTLLLPHELDLIVEGYADGCIRQTSFMQLCGKPEKLPFINKVSEPALNGFITALRVVQNPRTKERFIIGGADDGSVAFWTFDHFKLCARWVIFTTHLTSVIQVHEKQGGPLRGCILGISVDGTIAVIVVDGFQFLYLIPGAAAPVCRVCLGEHNILLIYTDRRARLWDIETKEFWRSMSLDKVDELLEQGEWIDLSSEIDAHPPETTLKRAIGSSTGIDVVSTLTLDLERFIAESTTVVKTISTNRDQTRTILLTLERLRCVLSALLTPGLNADIDAICAERLRIHTSPINIGFASGGAITLYNITHPQDPWCISGDVSAARSLAITVVLAALGLFEEYAESANTVIIFYATSLASQAGQQYQPPSLVYLANRWFDGSSAVRQAARTLFDYAIACLPDEEVNTTAEQWQHHLPCLQPSANRESTHAALALFICGYVACEKYSLVSTSALTDIAKSIALYLHDEHSLHRILAVDLCSRGFHIWQHYIDAMDILRALFTLATTSRKEMISTQNIGTQARLAVLQIASSNTTLFMTTLGLDILNPPSLEHRRTVLQIVAFLVRKRPLVLQPNIPKLMEAVVKSLDPNITTHREAVLDAATEIIGYVVKTFPSIDFHMGNQRLAVGSSEGAVIMYDLKTAIRLYVLDGHRKPITACSFSPDGRRLLTLSLEESVVLVWKVGSSFTSFFNPGAPPRQGHGGSQPYKTISFNVGDEANMNVSATLEWIKFEWVADRSVKLKIKESILTFST